MDMTDEAEMELRETCLKMSDAKNDDITNEKGTANRHPDDSVVKSLLYNVNEIPPVGIIFSIAMQVVLSYIHSEMLILEICAQFLTFQSFVVYQSESKRSMPIYIAYHAMQIINRHV